MMLKSLFRKREYITVSSRELNNIPNIPDDKWTNCNKCKNIIYKEDLQKNYNVCPNCGYHFKLSAFDRINQIFDNETFIEMFTDLSSRNPLDFDGYEEKLEANREKSKLNEAVVVGIGSINNIKVCTAIMDSNFMMGSMGSAVGEKITLLIEHATKHKLPLIIFTASGGARMQEGIFSLMQMAKISQAIAKHDSKGLLYLSIITNPTTGGVTASFAMQGDIIVAEPGATIGFAGRRVIENTIKQKLPDEFQTSEFAVEKGFVDSIVKRHDMKNYISKILSLHGVCENV